jgi:hypothetical protein
MPIGETKKMSVSVIFDGLVMTWKGAWAGAPAIFTGQTLL